MGGHSGYPNFSGRVFRVFENSGFENWNSKIVSEKENPTTRVPATSGSGSGNPEKPEIGDP